MFSVGVGRDLFQLTGRSSVLREAREVKQEPEAGAEIEAAGNAGHWPSPHDSLSLLTYIARTIYPQSAGFSRVNQKTSRQIYSQNSFPVVVS